MSFNDTIADMLTRIRNAVGVERPSVDMPISKVKRGLADVLKREGYIWDWEEVTQQPVCHLRIDLKYGPNGERVIQKIRRISTPGRRVDQDRHSLLGVALLENLGQLLVRRAVEEERRP